jgi:hypothetical protein
MLSFKLKTITHLKIFLQSLDLKLSLNMQRVEESQQSLAHQQKIQDTQNVLEKKVRELMKDEGSLKTENGTLVQQIKQKDQQIRSMQTTTTKQFDELVDLGKQVEKMKREN